jgi:hypothetical protein
VGEDHSVLRALELSISIFTTWLPKGYPLSITLGKREFKAKSSPFFINPTTDKATATKVVSIGSTQYTSLELTSAESPILILANYPVAPLIIFFSDYHFRQFWTSIHHRRNTYAP